MKSLLLLILLSFQAFAQQVCPEEVGTLHSEFIPTSFDVGRSTVGIDQVEPLKIKVREYISSHPEKAVKKVIITASSAKIPFYKTVKGKRIIDPDSDKKNLSLAKQRAGFAKKVMKELKGIEVETEAKLGGPDFVPLDLNNRFVTKMTPGYVERVHALFEEHRELYEDVLLSQEDLKDETKFGNLFQAKYKPFQGLKLVIIGHQKCETNAEESEDAGASRQ